MTRAAPRTTDSATRATEAERSAGRVGGYCWVEHEGGGTRCTLRPNHKGRHFNYYTQEEFD